MAGRVDEFISTEDEENYCSGCNEVCGTHCVIWRKALAGYDSAEKEGSGYEGDA